MLFESRQPATPQEGHVDERSGDSNHSGDIGNGEVGKEMAGDDKSGKAEDDADKQYLGGSGVQAGLHNKILEARGPGPFHHEAVKHGHAAEHFIAHEFHAEADVAAALGFPNGLHSAADNLLSRITPEEQRNAGEYHRHDQERENG